MVFVILGVHTNSPTSRKSIIFTPGPDARAGAIDAWIIFPVADSAALPAIVIVIVGINTKSFTSSKALQAYASPQNTLLMVTTNITALAAVLGIGQYANTPAVAHSLAGWAFLLSAS